MKLRRAIGAMVVGLITLASAALAVEATARHMQLDLHQGRPIQANTDPRGLAHEVPAALRDVDYLPRIFALDERGLETSFGSCSADFPGSTLLAMGDSLTVETHTAQGEALFVDTWPLLLARQLGPDWQVCVIAECGYHPTDFPVLARAVSEVIAPDLSVLLMCDNDFGPQLPRHLVRGGEGWILRHEPEAYTYWTGVVSTWLFRRSEAWRYFSWRLAIETGEGEEWPRDHVLRPDMAGLRGLGFLDPVVFTLPLLEAGASATIKARSAQWTSEVKVRELPLPAEPHQLRRAPEDDLHMNHLGHRWVAERMLEQIQQAGLVEQR